MSSTRLNRAFTLVELFIIIVIVAIAASILFPVYAQQKQKQGISVEMSHQKQIALGMLIYAQDYDEYYPLASTLIAPFDRSATTSATTANGRKASPSTRKYLQSWGPDCTLDANRMVPGLLMPYVKNGNLFLASEDPEQEKGHVLEFMYNDLLAGQRGRDVARPSVTVMLVSAEDRFGNVGHAYTPDAAAVPATFDSKGHVVPGQGATIDGARTRQKDGALFAFADGHVKWFHGGSDDPIFFPPRSSTSRSATDPTTKKQVGPSPDAHMRFGGRSYQGTFHIR